MGDRWRKNSQPRFTVLVRNRKFCVLCIHQRGRLDSKIV